MSLVVFTAFAGLILAPGTIHPLMAFFAIVCIAVGAGASGALNMWYDADIDAVMAPTANAPFLPARSRPNEALAFGLVLSAFSVAILGLAVKHAGRWPARLHHLLLRRRLYDVAEALDAAEHRHRRRGRRFPPMIGWACVTGGVSIDSICLFLIIFLWTPAHSGRWRCSR